MRVQHHLCFVEDLVQGRAAGAGVQPEADVAPGKFERRLRVDRQLLSELGNPALGVDRTQAEPRGEMPVERLAQGVGFIAAQLQGGGRHQDQPVAHQAQMDRIGARPAPRTRLAVRAEQRQRAGGQGLGAEVEGIVQPGFNALRLSAHTAPAREQQLDRRQARSRRRREQARDYELAVHRASGTTCAPGFERWRDRMR